MSFVITQNFSLVGRQVYLKCSVYRFGPGLAAILIRGPVTITKQIGPARYEAKALSTALTLTLNRDDFILPPTAIEMEPTWGKDTHDGFVYGPDSGFFNKFARK
jgi:hypothetical protein